MTSEPGANRGFSLLEVVVAFAVSALFLAAVLPAVVASVDRLDEVRTRSAALFVARSAVERHAALARFQEGAFEGREGGFTWRAWIEPLAPDPADGSAAMLALRQIRVEVSGEGPRPLISLATYRAGEIR